MGTGMDRHFQLSWKSAPAPFRAVNPGGCHSQHLENLSQAALGRYGAVGKAYSEPLSRRFAGPGLSPGAVRGGGPLPDMGRATGRHVGLLHWGGFEVGWRAGGSEGM